MIIVKNTNGDTLELPATSLQDYTISVLDNDVKLKELKKFFHVCRKTKNCNCLGNALRAEHCARHDAITAKNLANPVFKERFGC